MDKKAVIIGVQKLVYAKISAESTSSTTYGNVISVPGVIEVALSPDVTNESLGADNNVVYENVAELASIGVTLNVAALDHTVLADLLGHTVKTDKTMEIKADDVAPYVAIGFEATQSNGKGRKIWLLRGKFQESDETFHTKEQGSVNWQTPNITGTFGARLNDLMVKAEIDEDDVASGTAYTDFLTTVYGGASGTTT